MVHDVFWQRRASVLSGAYGPLQCRLSRTESRVRKSPACPGQRLSGRRAYRHGRSSLRSAAATGSHQLVRCRPDRPGRRYSQAPIAEYPPDRAGLRHRPYDPPGSAHARRLRMGRPRLPAGAECDVGCACRAVGDEVCSRCIGLYAIPDSKRRTAPGISGSTGTPRYRGDRHTLGGTALGKHLLMGESWDGELDLSDEPSVLIYLRRIGLIP